MGLKKVTPGRKLPDEINVIIEIPSRSDPVKYEVDWVKIHGWVGAKEAKVEVMAGVERYKNYTPGE